MKEQKYYSITYKRGRDRIIGLDIFRICSVLMVFLFHSHIHIGCSYGIANTFVSLGAVFMTAFFMLSGYVVSYSTYNSYSITEFYKKRFIGILPAYWGICILYPIFQTIINIYLKSPDKAISIITDSVVLIPAHVFTIQSIFDSLFSISHNGGTWFVSCLAFAYLLFPIINRISIETTTKRLKMALITLYLILVYAAAITHYYGTSSIYSNIWIRCCEFAIGVLIYHINKSDQKNSIIINTITVIGSLIALISLLQLGFHFGLGGKYMDYSYCTVPCFAIMIMTLPKFEIKYLQDSIILKHLCDISYMFFFAQFFTWTPTLAILNKLNIADSNTIKIITSLCLCTIISVLLHMFMEKPLKRLAQKLLLKKTITKRTHANFN